MTTKKLLERIPEEHKLDYLRSYTIIMNIKKKIKGFYPKDKDQQQILEEMLKEYYDNFKKLSDINKQIRKIS